MSAGENNPKTPSTVEQAVHTELVRLLFNSPTVPLINGVAALVTTGVLWRIFPLRVSLSWLILSLCVVVARVTLWSQFKRLWADTENIDVWGRRFTLMTTIAGCVWGLVASTALVSSNPIHYVFAAFVVGGLCAGAAIRLSPHPPAFYWYVGVSASPMVVTLLLKANPESVSMSALLLTFSVVMIIVGQENHQRLADYIRLKIEQEIMNADLQKAARDLITNQRQLEQMAHYDVLTGMPNRVLLADRLRQAMAEAHRRKQLVAAAYIDLDEFKQINDSYGHDTGDQVLRLLAQRMVRCLREHDTLARLGGDEFVALLLDLSSPQSALPVIDRLLKASSQSFEIGSQSLRVSASIGVAFYSYAEEIEPDQLLRRADQAMYHAKLTGKNRHHVFDPVQDIAVRGRHESLEQLRHALSKHQFVLHYQPQVNMSSGEIVGAEALLRLQHPERGLLLPEKFLPALEDHPLGITLGEWVIDSALTQMEAWEGIGLQIPISVNVSSFQLQDPAFIDRLTKLLDGHRSIKPSKLQLEIIETSSFRDLIQTSEALKACDQMGIALALDDFGTGYSSLTYLKRLPAQTIKIDRSFVSGVLENSDDKAIIEGILSLAKAFDREVIAEGVETTEQGMMLLSMGCDLAQGYSIARPMPPSRFPGWVEKWRPDSRWIATTV